MKRYIEDVVFGAVYTDKATVKKVQTALKINVDGIIGPQTRAAVKQFNEARGFPQDGDNITDGTVAAVEGGTAAQGFFSSLFGPSTPAAAPAGAPSPARASAASSAAPVVMTAPIALVQPAQTEESFFTRNVKGLNVPTWQVMLGAAGALAVGVGVYTITRGGPRRVR